MKLNKFCLKNGQNMGKKLAQLSFPLYLRVKIPQKNDGFSHILSYGNLCDPRINVFLV